MVQERRALSTDFEVVLDSALVESFNRVLLSGRSLVFSYPTVHTQQSTVPPGVAEHNVTVARAFTKLMGAFVTFCWPTRGRTWPPSARPGRRTASWSLRCSRAPSQPHERSLGALPLPLDPCGYLRRHGAQHRHRPCGLPAPQLHCRLSHRARAPDATEWCQRPLRQPGNLARFTFKALDGTMTDAFIHLIAYQLVTLSGTGVSVD